MSKSFLIAASSSFVILLAADFVWLSNAVNFLNRPRLGALLADKPVLWAAALFYVLYGIGLTFLVVRPAVSADSVFTALWTGALFGLVAYGTYDLTNQATLKGWSLTVTVVDMAWGATISAGAPALGVWFARKLA